MRQRLQIGDESIDIACVEHTAEAHMRHGRIFEVSELSSTELQVAIQDDIEDTWVNEH